MRLAWKKSEKESKNESKITKKPLPGHRLKKKHVANPKNESKKLKNTSFFHNWRRTSVSGSGTSSSRTQPMRSASVGCRASSPSPLGGASKTSTHSPGCEARTGRTEGSAGVPDPFRVALHGLFQRCEFLGRPLVVCVSLCACLSVCLSACLSVCLSPYQKQEVFSKTSHPPQVNLNLSWLMPSGWSRPLHLRCGRIYLFHLKLLVLGRFKYSHGAGSSLKGSYSWSSSLKLSMQSSSWQIATRFHQVNGMSIYKESSELQVNRPNVSASGQVKWK